MPLLDTALGFVAGLIVDTARGMSLDRFRHKIERSANADTPGGMSETDYLRDISQQLREQNRYNEQHGAGLSIVEYVDVLYRGEGLEHRINRQGRKHLDIMPFSSGVVLSIIGPVGKTNYTLTPGVYTTIDAPLGTVYRLDASSPNASENVSIRLYN